MVQMHGPFTTSAATGGAGAAAGTFVTPTPIRGYIMGVVLQYNDAPPAGTTDVGIKTKVLSGVTPSVPLLTVTNAATNGYFAPRSGCVTAAAAAITDSNAPFAVNDYIQIDMAQANDGDSVSVWLMVD